MPGEGRNPHGDGTYIPILDGWRAIAIFLVLAFHGLYNSDLTRSPHLQKLSEVTGRLGAFGVLIFFCISGNLITQRLLIETRMMGRLSLSAFYIKRAFRILPPLFVYLLAILLLFFLGSIKLEPRDWSAPLFIANYLQGSWYTSHFWSLSVEEHFYLFWPVCALVAGWRKSMWIGLAVICSVAVWRPWRLHHVASMAATLQHTDMRVDYIMCGAVLAIAMEVYPSSRLVLRRLGTLPGLTLLVVLLLGSTQVRRVDLRSLQAIVIALIVCASWVANEPFVGRVLGNRYLLFFGKLSYSLYIWQQLFLAPASEQYLRSPLLLPAKYLGAVLIAFLSFKYVEGPFIRYGRNVAKDVLNKRREQPA